MKIILVIILFSLAILQELKIKLLYYTMSYEERKNKDVIFEN